MEIRQKYRAAANEMYLHVEKGYPKQEITYSEMKDIKAYAAVLKNHGDYPHFRDSPSIFLLKHWAFNNFD